MEWIDVNDRLPEKGQQVLIFPYKIVFFGHQSENDNNFWEWDDYYQKNRIIYTNHWAALTEPPKK